MQRSQQYLEGYRNGWLDAWLGHQSDYAVFDQTDYGSGYRAGHNDRVTGSDPAHITFLNHIRQEV